MWVIECCWAVVVELSWVADNLGQFREVNHSPAPASPRGCAWVRAHLEREQKLGAQRRLTCSAAMNPNRRA